ncbi:DUF4184 family protein [Glaciihabitans sp. dw_435]|uniref:DUF4184 family protein n=1 Tax=Glaciihabitans sp. dw_435 TaxID=2720081 RepID=UPI001BD5C8D1|nr:DUF4184 family protein [Glaciihabitans sp. dw_435]
MPFTPSHIAAILPFARTRLVPAGLVAGSVAPDLFYYIPVRMPRDLSHSLLGVVTVDLAFGVVAVVLWQVIFRRPVVDFLPLWARARLASLPWTGLRAPRETWVMTAVLLVASIIVGTLTHLLWDTFTHPGWPVDAVPWLRAQAGPLLVHKWIQHASSVAGIVILVVWAVRWVRATAPSAPAPTRLAVWSRALAWIITVAAGLTGGLTVWIHGMLTGRPALDPALVFITARAGVAAACLAAVLIALIWWVLPTRVSPVVPEPRRVASEIAR